MVVEAEAVADWWNQVSWHHVMMTAPLASDDWGVSDEKKNPKGVQNILDCEHGVLCGDLILYKKGLQQV